MWALVRAGSVGCGQRAEVAAAAGALRAAAVVTVPGGCGGLVTVAALVELTLAESGWILGVCSCGSNNKAP